ALRFALERYKEYFFGTITTVWTDNKDLLVVNSSKPTVTPKIERLRIVVKSYPNLTVKHVEGARNPADFISRNLEVPGDPKRALPAVCLVVRLKGMTGASGKPTTDPEGTNEFCALLPDDGSTDDAPTVLSGLDPDVLFSLDPVPSDDLEVVLDDEEEPRPLRRGQDPFTKSIDSWKWDTALRCFCRDGIVCPAIEHRLALAHHYHSLAHGGQKTTLQNLAVRFWWPSMAQDVRSTVRHCMVCRMTKARGLEPGFEPWPDPSRKMERVHADHFVMKKVTVLVLADAFSGFIWAKPVDDLTEKTTTEILDDIFAVFGKPALLVADNGPGFGQQFTAMMMARGIQRASSIPEKPQSNGLAEVSVGIVKGTTKKLGAAFPTLPFEAALRRASV
ncbi:MAG: hypothetical protein KVP17_003172, partial [Porospora cf. gigantea B]|uniref:uncharacterized protein n=1 Tax=Porospora cf. gigantea B TaxID=2853592 RepID=UPI003571E7D8